MDTMNTAELVIQDLDHLGLIAGIIDELDLVALINTELGEHPQEHISAGQVVKALILNCLGFLSAPLYLFSQFFEGKATTHLLGEGIEPRFLNDSRIGQVLDKLYKRGVTEVFLKLALAAVKRFGVSVAHVHGDSSSFYVHGKYGGELGTEAEPGSEEGAEEVPIQVKHGYSRDHRPDLRQFTLNLITSTDGDVPLGLRVGNGNEVDSKVLVPFLRQWQESWQEEGGISPQVFAGDAALYTEENLQILGSLPWITRVPATVGEAQEVMKRYRDEGLQECGLAGYRVGEVCSEYGGVRQRWVVVESQARREADERQLEKQVKRLGQQYESGLKQLERKEFACEADARRAVEEWGKQLSYYVVREVEVEIRGHYGKRGRPKAGEEPSHYSYHLKARLELNSEEVEAKRGWAGRFIVATNCLEEQEWPAAKVLKEYKDQTCERGFRFLKDPLFFVSRVYLKSRQRLMVMAMLMGVSLLVYSLGQRQVRQALKQEEASLPNQKGKGTQRPTMRWLMQCLQAVHIVWREGVKYLSPLNERQRQILKYFSPHCRKYYLLC